MTDLQVLFDEKYSKKNYDLDYKQDIQALLFDKHANLTFEDGKFVAEFAYSSFQSHLKTRLYLKQMIEIVEYQYNFSIPFNQQVILDEDGTMSFLLDDHFYILFFVAGDHFCNQSKSEGTPRNPNLTRPFNN